jgi:hypothetical protein
LAPDAGTVSAFGVPFRRSLASCCQPFVLPRFADIEAQPLQVDFCSIEKKTGSFTFSNMRAQALP